jgi:phosphopantothenoylcysteine decarboxylase/phosphopantothenate--cysteine ligase
VAALSGRKLLLCVCGGIAAYKAAELVRRLREAGAEVRVAMTADAHHFVGAATFQALSGHPVRDSLWDAAAEAAMGHIELARWPDRIVIAPATANTLARLAHGLADDLVSTLCLATEAPILAAPAMNRVMWSHPATQANIETLRSRRVRILGPASGGQACGETGEGRMVEPDDIVAAVAETFTGGRSA